MDEYKSYTYFAIVGNFKTKDIIKLLDMKPVEKWDIGDKLKYRDAVDFAKIKLVKSTKNTLILEEQAQEIVSILKPKIPILQEIFERYDVKYFIQTVGYFNEDGIPAISFDKDVIEFCYLTNSAIDCDLYDMR